MKEALGVRRELSFLGKKQASLPTVLGGSPVKMIPANPPSEFLFVFIESKGLDYEGSPKAFGIDFRHMQP